MDANANSLPPITDFEAAYIIAQYAHENGFRSGTGKDFYLWITSMLDLLGLSNTAGLPQYLPEPGSALTATAAKQWTFLFPNDDGTAATYNKITSGTITVPGDSIAIAQFDGTDYNTVRFIKVPRGEDGKDGVDGASLLKQWSDTSSDYPYGLNVAVRDAEGGIYVSMVDNNNFPLTDETKWLKVGSSGAEVSSDNMFEIADEQGNIYLYIDGKGFFRTRFPNRSLPIETINGLGSTLETLIRTAGIESESDNAIEIVSPDGRDIYGYMDKKGVWHLDKLRTKGFTSSKESGTPQPSAGIQVTKEREVFLPEMPFFILNLEVSPQPGTALNGENGTALLMDASGRELVKFNVETFVQGQGSIGFPKKNLTIDLFNNEGKSVDLKFGYMIPADSFHLKGYWTDTMHVRDVGCGDLWYQTLQSRPFPFNMFVELGESNEHEFSSNRINVEAEARYTHIGYRCAVYNFGQFFGLYTWRQKKTRENYSVDRDDPNHIFIESLRNNTGLGRPNYQTFSEVEQAYEFRSPRNLTQPVQDNTMRFFDWCAGVYAGDIDMRATYQDYIDLYAWIDWTIICELIGHWDTIGNNAAYITYNGTKWKPILIDTDQTVGIERGDLIQGSTISGYVSDDIIGNLKTVFRPEFRTRYQELKNNGTLTQRNLFDTFRKYMVDVPLWVYEYDYERWGCFTNGTAGNKGIPEIKHMMRFLNNRLQFLENTWG